MHELGYLKDVLAILGVAVIVVVVFHRLRLPAIAGFILSGILVGPQGLQLVDDSRHIEVLAEVGVALLLFGIGLELPLQKLKRLWKLAAVGGTLQVVISAATAFGIGRMAGLSNSSAVLIGFVVALSSTAVVLRGLQERGELNAPHGRLILGILVFQDFSVVPIMLIIPLLAGVELSVGAFVLTLAKSIGIVLVVLLLAILIVPRILKLVAQTRQRHLFILTVFVVCLGIAWLVTRSGASLPIGAFLAGLVVAGGEYRHQVLADMISFREIFASLFFVSVGMLLSPETILSNLVPIAAILAAILLGKSAIVFISALVMRMPLRVCIISALALAQVGEFSLILLYAMQGTGIVADSVENNLVSAAILSMAITPFFMSYGPRLASGFGKSTQLMHMMDTESVEDTTGTIHHMKDHIIVAGYGFAGKELSQALLKNSTPYMIVDLNIDNVGRASRDVGNAVFGDITSDTVLKQLGIQRARELVLLINDPAASEHAARIARAAAPDLFITVRTTYLQDVESLLAAGANEVVPAEREAAVQVMTQVMTRQQVGSTEIAQQASEIRDHLDEEDS